jgi:hypothetical protein
MTALNRMSGRYPRCYSAVRPSKIEDSSSQCNATRTGPLGEFEVIWYGVTHGPSNPTSASDLKGSIFKVRRRSTISRYSNLSSLRLKSGPRLKTQSATAAITKS